MIYYSHSTTGEVFAYETEADRDQFGPPELVLMTPEQVQAHLNPPAPTPSVPASITMRQCRLQLLATGKLGLVQPAIDSMSEPQRSAANIEWEYGAVVWRNSPLIAQLAPVLGWDSPEAIDQQFIAAGAL